MFAISPNGELLSGTRRDSQADMIRLMVWLMVMISVALGRDCSGRGDINGCYLMPHMIPRGALMGMRRDSQADTIDGLVY